MEHNPARRSRDAVRHAGAKNTRIAVSPVGAFLRVVAFSDDPYHGGRPSFDPSPSFGSFSWRTQEKGLAGRRNLR
jgi:hypothetical protein